MLGLLVCFGGLLTAGLFFLAVDLLRLSHLKTPKAVINMGRENRKAAESLETYLLSLTVKLAPYIHMDEYGRGRQKNILKASGLNMEPEACQTYVISKARLALLGITPCLLIFPLLAMIAVVLAVMMYLKEQERADELPARKRGKLEGELSRFVSAIEQELKNSRDVLSIVKNYKKSTEEELANELEILAVDIRSSNYEVTLTRFEARVNSLMLSDMVGGLVGVLRGNDEAMYSQILFRGSKQTELQRLEKEAQKTPPKIRVFSSLILVCFAATYLTITILGVLKSMGSMFQKGKRRRRKDMNSAKNQTGMAGKEVEDGNGRRLPGTAREFLKRYPKGSVSMMTPGGYVCLIPGQIGNLLVGGVISRNPYNWRECAQVKAERPLQQMMDSVNHADGTWYVLMRLYEPEVIPARTSEEGVVCHV